MAKSRKKQAKQQSGKSALDQYKMEAASEMGVDLDSDNLSAKQAGKVGGQMVKNMVEKAKKSNK